MKLPFVRMNARAQTSMHRRLMDALTGASIDGWDATDLNGVFAFDDDLKPTASLACARWVVGVVDGRATVSRVDNAGVMHAVIPDQGD